MTKFALVLAGGGARGAYEAGVLLYISEKFSRSQSKSPFQIITGTSVGAIHACYIAAYAHEFREGMKKMVDLWCGMDFNSVIHSHLTGIFDWPYFEAAYRWKFLKRFRKKKLPRKFGGFFDTAPLEKLVVNEVPWRNISKNVREGVIDALAVTATDMSTGKSTVFVETGLSNVAVEYSDRMSIFVKTRILPVHALASSAIPFIFPSVRIGKKFYVDGGVRMMTPLRPAIHLGAEKILAISLKCEEECESPPAPALSPFRMGGKVLNSFFIDKMEADVKFALLINEIIKAGEEACGETFFNKLSEVRRQLGKKSYRKVEIMLIRPSKDIGRIAARYSRDVKFSLKPGSFLYSLLPRLLAVFEGKHDTDLLSYLLFDRKYAGELIDLGYEDARKMHHAFEDFFTVSS